MIAPLLDIMFLVLLFFILNTSSGSVESFDVDIPQASQGRIANHLIILWCLSAPTMRDLS